MSKKDLVIVVLATFCLTASLFMILPTRSQSGGYDPWLDTNDDGSINILESILTGNHFLTSGDPAKAVMTASYNWSYGYYFATPAPGESGSFNITTGGYRRITLGFRASPFMMPVYGNVSMATGFSMKNTSMLYVNVDRFAALPGWTGPDLPILREYPVVKAYEIVGEILTVAYYNQNPDPFNLWVEYYITA